jgi:glycosyltransferase involved in cell wall biosynthesis
MEAWSSLGALLYGGWLLVSLRPRSRRPVPPARTLAFLRTDFWFGLKAGGSITHLAGFLTGIRALGMSARIVTSDHLPAMPPDAPQTVVPPRGHPRILEELALVRYNARFVREALQVLRHDPPDVIVHRHSVFSVAGALVARALDRPLVLEVNGSEVWVRRSWSRLHFAGLAAALERRSLAAADRIAVVSAPLRDVLVEHGVDPARIVVNPNGVAVSRFDPAFTAPELRRKLGFEADHVVVGFSGTFLRWHGVLFLASRIAALTAAGPRLRFLFLGDGDLRPAVEQAIEADGAGAACVFTGLVGHDEVPAHLAACDILVSPHLPFEDGTATFFSPTKLFEYMAAGRAIVASRLGQIAEVITDGENGLLHAPGDAAEFQAAVLRLAGDPSLRLRLGGEARRGAEATYTWDANARRAVGPDPDAGGS